jgi:N4-gp56 family major capsid protein
MAQTSFAVGDALTRKLWSKRFYYDALKTAYVGRFIGKSARSLVQLHEEPSKGAGDTVTFGLRMQLSGAGVQGDAVLEGNEESLTTYSDAVLLNQTRHAASAGGRMTRQRVLYDLRQENYDALQDWFTGYMDTAFFNQICGYTVAGATTLANGNNAAIAPDANHRLYQNGNTTDQGVNADTAAVANLTMIDKCVAKAKTLSPMINPIKVGGKDMYVMFLHPWQVYNIRTTTSTGQWLDIQKAAMTGGSVDDNPIFTGALGVYNNVVLHEATRVTQGVHSTTSAAQTSTRRAVFCGAQAAAIAFGQGNDPDKMTWVEKLFDYDNQLGVAVGSIFGLKKAVFNSADFGTITVSTYAVSPT